jgi:hypothetical protein
VTPTDAALMIAWRAADLGTSIRRCADAILVDRDEFEARYRRAARGCDREMFPDLLAAHATLTTHHDTERTQPT